MKEQYSKPVVETISFSKSDFDVLEENLCCAEGCQYD